MQGDATGSAQAEVGRASTSRRLHSCAKSTCCTASAHSANAALQQPCSSQMSISRSQRLHTRRLHSSRQYQGSWLTVPSPASHQSLRMGAVSTPRDGRARPSSRPSRACNGRARQGHRGFGSFFAWYLIFARLASCSDESRDIARLGNMLTRCPLKALT